MITGGLIRKRVLLLTSPRGTAPKKLKKIYRFGHANSVNSSNFNATTVIFAEKFNHPFSHVFIFGKIFCKVAVSIHKREQFCLPSLIRYGQIGTKFSYTYFIRTFNSLKLKIQFWDLLWNNNKLIRKPRFLLSQIVKNLVISKMIYHMICLRFLSVDGETFYSLHLGTQYVLETFYSLHLGTQYVLETDSEKITIGRNVNC